MKHKFTWLLFACLIGLNALMASAQSLSLKPGESATVNFDRIHVLENGTPPVAYRNVGAAATFTLDATGKKLTVSLQNLSLPDSGAALYALDLGLHHKVVLQTEAELIEGNFPTNAPWLGPTDNVSVTNGTGTFTFAALEAVLAQMSAFTSNQAALPAGFFLAGQRGSFTMQLTFADEAKALPLRLRPVAYFVAPDFRSATPKRLQLAAFGAGQGNNAR